jgi:PilZ domain
MSHNGLSAEARPPDASPEVPSEDASPLIGAVETSQGHYTDLQSAIRFPIQLPVVVKSKSGESRTETENISANGVLFRLDAEMPVGSPVDFTISLPADVIGTGADVQLDCRGRVVRSCDEDGRRGVGVVIDEYRFERR